MRRDVHFGDDGGLAGIVNLGRYPLQQPSAEDYRKLVSYAKQELATVGACVLEGFLTAEAVARTLVEVEPLEAGAFVCRQPHNVFLVPPDPAYDDAHPRNRVVRSVKAVLADDEIPKTSPLRTLYGSAEFKAFICDALDIEALHPYEDNLASLNINFYGDDQELGWHFDNSNFTITLMLRQADRGGEFEYAPNIRDEDPAGFETLGRILDGDHSLVRELKQDPGALVLFKGSKSLHRVTRSYGVCSRAIAVFSYAPEPGATLKHHTRAIFYGREL